MNEKTTPKYNSSVFFVKDTEKSKKFYTEILGQKIEMDFGRCVVFVGGFAIWDLDYAHNMMGIKENNNDKSAKNNVESYFEIEDIINFHKHIKNKKISFVHDLKEQPWGQRCFRIYDPDNHIIEFAEPMTTVIHRLHNEGLTIDEIVKKSLMPIELVKSEIRRSNKTC